MMKELEGVDMQVQEEVFRQNGDAYTSIMVLVTKSIKREIACQREFEKMGGYNGDMNGLKQSYEHEMMKKSTETMAYAQCLIAIGFDARLVECKISEMYDSEILDSLKA